MLYSGLATPVKVDHLLSIDQMNFSRDEVREYVCNWFKDMDCFQKRDKDGEEALKVLCTTLQRITGGHVGFCATAIDKLNAVILSYNRRCQALPPTKEYINMLKSEDMQRALMSCRGGSVLKTLTKDEFIQLEHAMYDEKSNIGIIETCIGRGILTVTEEKLKFTSTVLMQIFTRICIGYVCRAVYEPNNLQTFLRRVMNVVDWESICPKTGKSFMTGIPSKRVWQMQFYRAAYRCLPLSAISSPDVGGMSRSKGCIDFTVGAGLLVRKAFCGVLNHCVKASSWITMSPYFLPVAYTLRWDCRTIA
ncbi:unnamed protein product [Phytophthora lilii]|uniref:Unnamed protein product n=1 Tax=Phytophthora lilii TaxID=2077276 RepID=A0A9W6WFN5_9STRA|nr:unnamed protein product [Phytophthora lilii]